MSSVYIRNVILATLNSIINCWIRTINAPSYKHSLSCSSTIMKGYVGASCIKLYVISFSFLLSIIKMKILAQQWWAFCYYFYIFSNCLREKFPSNTISEWKSLFLSVNISYYLSFFDLHIYIHTYNIHAYIFLSNVSTP